MSGQDRQNSNEHNEGAFGCMSIGWATLGLAPKTVLSSEARFMRYEASSGSCDPEHRGGICPRSSVLIPLATTASFAGVGLAFGAGSWTHWLLLMMQRSK